MDDAPIVVRKYTDFAEMKADEYRYWQSRPAHERIYRAPQANPAELPGR